MDVLTKCLFDLSSDGSGISAKDLVAQIEAVATSPELQGVDLQHISYLLLQSEKSPPSLLRFVVGTVGNKDLKEAKKLALKVLAKYVKEKGVLLQDSAEAVFRSLCKFFRREDGNEVKAECIPVLMNLLRTCTLSAADVDLVAQSAPHATEGTFLQFLSELKICKSTGLRANLFKLIGMFVHVFGDEAIVQGEGDGVVNWCLKVGGSVPACVPCLFLSADVLPLLPQEVKESVKTSDKFPVIAGAFSCLDRCMYAFGTRFRGNGGEELLKLVVNGVSTVLQKDVTRYAVAAKAMRLLKNHAETLSHLIAMNAEVVYEQVRPPGHGHET